MNKSSCLIKDKVYFGPYPTQADVKELEENGVILFVDLTNSREGLPKYVPSCEKIDFPITDYGIPSDIPDFCQLIVLLEKKIDLLKENQKIYINCKGGHGRAGVASATLLAHYKHISAEEAIKLTTIAHRQRKILAYNRKNTLCPEKQKQRDFVIHLFEPIYFYRATKIGIDVGFSNFSPHSVITKLGTFPNAESAFQAYKDPKNEKYVNDLKNEKNPHIAKKMGVKCNLRPDWKNVRDKIMYFIIRAKFMQNQDIKINLLQSGFRKLIFHSDKDIYFGSGGDSQKGKNVMGLILEKVREKLFMELYN